MDQHRKFAAWLLAAAYLLLLLLPAAACLDIYFDGEGFSRESIALRFAAIAPALGICVLVGAVAFPAALRARKNGGADPAGRAMYRRGKEEKPAAAIPAVLLGLAGAFILLGVINGGARDVLIKAINICTECIGLG